MIYLWFLLLITSLSLVVTYKLVYTNHRIFISNIILILAIIVSILIMINTIKFGEQGFGLGMNYLLFIAFGVMILSTIVYEINYTKHCQLIKDKYDEHWDSSKYKNISTFMIGLMALSLCVVLVIIAIAII